MVTLSGQPWLTSIYGEKAEVTFVGVTYSSLAIINKEELLGEWQFFKRAVFQKKKVMIKHQPTILAGHKRHHGNKLFLYISRNF